MCFVSINTDGSGSSLDCAAAAVAADNGDEAAAVVAGTR